MRTQVLGFLCDKIVFFIKSNNIIIMCNDNIKRFKTYFDLYDFMTIFPWTIIIDLTINKPAIFFFMFGSSCIYE